MALKIGDKVYLHHLKCFGVVKRLNSFGLSYCPTVQLSNKKQYVFPGKNVNNICDKIELFIQKQKDLSWQDNDINVFIDIWFKKTTIDTRQPLYDELVRLINTGNEITLNNYLAHVKNTI